MRLRNIKLSGFKSFVDPTTLTVPGQIVGVVGPNGCGKSNIIDAVTWVMGESSAKHLRGDALTDVIFNGSTARQPVGQAAVELIFDNSEKKVGGQYASYNEISIKRQINRDAVSTYFLNGTRCRRKDITDLFLGTGLGPRSYSIIEQGMISRLIEAKPEELRVFIEEAAGISKYRERRRETENRIRHTKENMSRLNDIQEELEKQLAHLQRQAKAAEKYKTLKAEERQLDAELLAINWQNLKQQNDENETRIRDNENKVESAVADLRQVEKDIETGREQLVGANEAFNEKQSVFYQVGADISQLEQSIKHTREKLEATKQEQQQASQQLNEVESQYKNDTASLQQLQRESSELEPRLLGSRTDSDKAYAGLNLAEQAMQSWQSEWDKFNQAASDSQRNSEINEARMEHLTESLSDLAHRLQSMTEEYESIEPDSLQKLLDDRQQAVNEADSALENLKQEQQDKQLQISNREEQLYKQQDELHQLKESKQQRTARLETLKALQESAYDSSNEIINDWLNQQQLQSRQRLAKQLDVDSEWSTALEIVMAEHLQAVCVDDIDSYLQEINSIETGKLELFQFNAADTSNTSGQSLADKVKSPASIRPLLSQILVSDSWQQACEIRQQLQANQSVITRDGIWMGQNWLRVHRPEGEDSSLIAREQEIGYINQQLTTLLEQIRNQESALAQSRSELEQDKSVLKELNEHIARQQNLVSEKRGELVATETQKEQLQNRAEHLRDQLDELEQTRQQEQSELYQLQQTMTDTANLSDDLEQQKQELVGLREQHQSSLEQARKLWQETHELSHGIALQLEAISSRKASMEQAIKRNELQSGHIRKRLNELQSALDECIEPLEKMQSDLEIRLKDKLTSEQELASARTAVQDLEAGIRELEQKRSQAESTVQSCRESLEKVRMASQETRVRLSTIEEQFTARDEDLKAVIESLAEDANEQDWKEKLEAIGRKITRLGPINLAAIDEHAQLTERKEYLDSQEKDLSEALETLESAIRKIDHETRSRFKETFDQLNDNLKETFPRIFGGGQANLELTSQDLLETGITVMARPPGKKNTTIHLLSGGEKALTAVALVFAIFKLNPAPFCILDEVDAPLDDANAGRFSELVKSMSDDVQFIVITHNKITMEIAQQLLGVTMHEPGVSRLVTVDVDAAVEMAASA